MYVVCQRFSFDPNNYEELLSQKLLLSEQFSTSKPFFNRTEGQHSDVHRQKQVIQIPFKEMWQLISFKDVTNIISLKFWVVIAYSGMFAWPVSCSYFPIFLLPFVSRLLNPRRNWPCYMEKAGSRYPMILVKATLHDDPHYHPSRDSPSIQSQDFGYTDKLTSSLFHRT